MGRAINRPTIVYQATNLVNGKTYIGVTSRPLKIRADTHWYSRCERRGYVIARAMKKYGRDMFRFRVLKVCVSFTEALCEEVRLIGLLAPDYNLTAGGEGCFGRVVSAKQRRDTAKRMKRDGGKVWAASAAAHRKPVICLKDGKIYLSGKAAAEAYSVSCASLTWHLRGRNATAAGKLFAFYTGTETALPDHDDIVQSILQRQRLLMIKNTSRRPVVCTTTGSRYPSMRHTEAETGVPYGCLSRILGKRGLKSWHGLKFEYAT